MRKLLITVLTVLTITSVHAADTQTDNVVDRIKPIGQVYIAGAEPVQAAAPTGPKSGAEVYQGSCFACHGTGAMNAPKKGDAAAWASRKAQGMDVLLDHAINGFNNMPARGTCTSCSDDEIKSAIDFMLEGS